VFSFTIFPSHGKMLLYRKGFTKAEDAVVNPLKEENGTGKEISLYGNQKN